MIQFSSEILFVKILTYGIGDGKGISWKLCLYRRLSPAIPTDMLRFLLVAHAFFAHVLCNSPYRLRQAQNMSGSVLLTTEAPQLSVGIAGKQHCINIEDSLMIVKKVQQIDKFT